MRPVTMVARLLPYRRYYSSHRTTDGHGVQAAVLVVFNEDIALTHFLGVAREDMASPCLSQAADRAGVALGRT